MSASEAFYLSPLRGSNSATIDRNASRQFDRGPRRVQEVFPIEEALPVEAHDVCDGAPGLFLFETLDASDGAPEARQIFSPGRKPRGSGKNTNEPPEGPTDT